MNAISIEERVIHYVYSPEYRPMKPKVLAQKLELTEEEYATLRRTIKRLVRSGQIAYLANHLIAPNGKRNAGTPNLLHGTFRLAYAGYGFVRPNLDGDRTPDEDIFIPAKYVGTAMNGDLVRVRLREGRDGRQEGLIQDILERARRQFPGSYQSIDGKSVVWLDGVQLDQPVEVGDVRGLPLKDGDKVIVELVRYPQADQVGEGVILEVLGSSKNPAVDTIAVMRQFNLPEEFTEAVISQARSIADRFTEEIPPDRRDLTKVPTLTIDPIDARDFDDAISLFKNDVGNWELQVHIADVAHFVPIGTPVDEEAKLRATSVYLPDKVIPMLPEIISNHLASLQPDRNRYAKTVLMEYSPEGVLIHWDVYNSVIRNAQRLNYEQVDQFLSDREPFRSKWAPAIFQKVGDMYELAMLLRKRRLEKGALELTLPEVKIDLDRSGKVKGAHLVENTDSHKMIEEFMLAANQTVATWLDDLDLPFLRRIHAPPKRIKLRRLTHFVRGLGIDCENLEDRFEMQKVIESVRGSGLEPAVNYAILKSMSKAIYQPEHEQHYALNMAHYCHFTSPIRRYPDLVVHRVVQRLLELRQTEKALLLKKGAKELGTVADPLPILTHLGHHCSDQEQNAEAAERELTKVKLLHFMSKKVGEELHGSIITVRDGGFFVRATEIPAEGWVSVESLPPDRYRFDSEAQVVEGYRNGSRYRLGDQLVVRVDRVDFARRQLWFVVTKHLSVASLPSSLPSSRTRPSGKKRNQASSMGSKRKSKRSPKRKKR